MKKTTTIYFLVLLIFTSCVTSNGLVKKGKKLEEAGFDDKAVEYYFSAVSKKKDNIKALAALRDAGKKVLQNKIDNFFKQYAAEKYKEAVYTFIDAEKFKVRLESFGVKSEIQEQKYSDFEHAKSVYFSKTYDDATELMEDDKFKEAEKLFNEIYAIDPSYNDVSELRNLAYLEPKYLSAVEQMELKNYRSAYAHFATVLKRDESYKDSKQLQAECIELGKVTIALMEIADKKFYNKDSKFITYSINAILSKNDPFLKIVDRENLEKVLAEQKFALSGLVDQESAVKVGDILGAQYALLSEVVDEKPMYRRPVKTTTKGFEKYRLKVYDPKTKTSSYKTRYKSVDYTKVYGENSVFVNIQYRLISLQTGEVVYSNVISKTSKSVINYIDYAGDKKNLYPSKNGVVDINRSSKNEIDRLLKGNRNLLTIPQLSDATYKDLSKQLSNEVAKKLAD